MSFDIRAYTIFCILSCGVLQLLHADCTKYIFDREWGNGRKNPWRWCWCVYLVCSRLCLRYWYCFRSIRFAIRFFEWNTTDDWCSLSLRFNLFLSEQLILADGSMHFSEKASAFFSIEHNIPSSAHISSSIIPLRGPDHFYWACLPVCDPTNKNKLNLIAYNGLLLWLWRWRWDSRPAHRYIYHGSFRLLEFFSSCFCSFFVDLINVSEAV